MLALFGKFVLLWGSLRMTGQAAHFLPVIGERWARPPVCSNQLNSAKPRNLVLPPLTNCRAYLTNIDPPRYLPPLERLNNARPSSPRLRNAMFPVSAVSVPPLDPPPVFVVPLRAELLFRRSAQLSYMPSHESPQRLIGNGRSIEI